MASTLDGNAKAMNLNPRNFKLWSSVPFPLAKRYHQAGPQKTLYIPGPILKVGLNEIVIFDTYGGGQVPREIFHFSISSLEISHGSSMPSLICPAFSGCSFYGHSESWRSCGSKAKCNAKIEIVTYQARALRALGLLLADGAPTLGRGKTFWHVSRIFLRKQL